MTDKDPPGDDDERETIAGDTSAPRDDPTQEDFDLESLPGRRPPPRQTSPVPPAAPPARRKLPEIHDDLDLPDATAPEQFAPTPGEAAPQPSAGRPSTETPTREIDVEREMPTIVGEFASTASGASPASPPSSDEAETIVEPRKSDSTGPDLGKGTEHTDASGRTAGRPLKSPLSKAASRTARDPIAGTAAQRGTQPWSGGSGTGALAEGQLLADRYELVERLGKGGMGEVWKAKHILLQGMRAIKVIKASISKDPNFRQRFLREGQTMMRVKHPGVVEVTDLDETRANRELFMVMEYLKGRTIYDAIRSKDKPLAADARDAARVLREVALGMQRIHDERIVHKDLKADNVLLVVGDDGLEHPKVIDFGLAKSLGDADAVPPQPDGPSPQGYDPDLHTTLSGTLAYMAPEQFRHEPSTFQSDIYAFGVMAYEVFSNGEFPLPRGPLSHYMDLHGKNAAPDLIAKKRPDIDPRLAAILDQCLAVRREDRPPSFARVAADLEYWLDTPEREARRKRRIYYYSAAASLVAIAAYGFIWGGETSASLSNLKATAAGVTFTFDGTTAHVPAAALPALVLTADIKGKPGDPVLEIDGHRREAKSELRHDQLVVTADLHDVADGAHSLSLQASANAAPANLTLDVDRVPPDVGPISVPGAVVTPAGTFSNSESPEVAVEIKEPGLHIAEVFAITPEGVRSPGERESGADRWIIKGTALPEGTTELDVVVRDLAGNETKRHLAYVRDVKKPAMTIDNLFPSLAPPGRSPVEGVWVREREGSNLHVSVSEAADVSVVFGDAPAAARHVDAAGSVDVEIPPVPAAGFRTKVVVRDLAGNETAKEFPLGVVRDFIRVMNSTGGNDLAVRGDGQEPGQIIVIRPYPLGDGFQLWARRVRNADGSEAADAPRQPLRLDLLNNAAEGKTLVFLLESKALPDGVWDLTATVAERVDEVQPLTATVDSAQPVVESVEVVDSSTHRPVAPGGWVLGRDVVVTAVVSDLSLSRIDLSGTRPAGAMQPGRGTYVFEKRLDREGPTTWTLSLADGTGHHVERAVNVLADWTVPEIVNLDSPRDGGSYTDVQPVKFVGACSEAAYTLVVEGLPGVERKAIWTAAEFEQEFVLPATDGPVPVDVVAVDPAGHRSAPRRLTISVVHKTTDLPDEVTSAGAVKVPMEKVAPGDVVIGGRVRSVGLVFVDRTEVTNAQYRAFLAATGGRHGAWCHPDEPNGWDHTPGAATWNDPKWNADDLPVVNVAYWDAYAFATWSGRRLPTEAEWVKAAAKSKAAGETELRVWPPFGPGEEWRSGVVVTAEWAKGPVSALTGTDVSPVGCLHMGGNVSEWVDLPGPVDGSPAATRGGSWFFGKRAADVRNTPAKSFDRSFRANTIGLRCAVDASRVQP